MVDTKKSQLIVLCVNIYTIPKQLMQTHNLTLLINLLSSSRNVMNGGIRDETHNQIVQLILSQCDSRINFYHYTNPSYYK